MVLECCMCTVGVNWGRIFVHSAFFILKGVQCLLALRRDTSIDQDAIWIELSDEYQAKRAYVHSISCRVVGAFF